MVHRQAKLRWIAGSVAAAMLLMGRAWAVAPVDFAHDVLPILQQHCAKCHTDGRYEGAISFDTREAVLEAGVAEPGASAESSLDRSRHDGRPRNADAARSAATLSRGSRRVAALDRCRVAVAGRLFVQEECLRTAAQAASARIAGGRCWGRQSRRSHHRRILAGARRQPPKPLGDRRVLSPRESRPRRAAADDRRSGRFRRRHAPDKRARLVRRLLDDRVGLRRSLAHLLERPPAERLRRHRLHRRRPKQITAWLYRALVNNKPYDAVRPRAGVPEARVGRFCQGHRLARPGERQPAAGAAVRAERRPGVPGRQSEVCLLPRQLHRQLEADRRLRPGGDHQPRAARDPPLRQADRRDRRRRIFCFPNWAASTRQRRAKSGSRHSPGS